MMTRQEYHKLADKLLAAFQVYMALEEYRDDKNPSPEAEYAYKNSVEVFDAFKKAAKEGVEMANDSTASGNVWEIEPTSHHTKQDFRVIPGATLDPRTNTPWVNLREMETKIASLEAQVKELEWHIQSIALDLEDERLSKLMWKAKARKLKARLLAEKLAQALNAEREARQEYEAEDVRQFRATAGVGYDE